MPIRSAAAPIERSRERPIGGTLNRKTSLLRTVPTACGQAADKASSRPRRAGDFHSPGHAITLPMLGDCASIATLCHDRLSERSYLFTMSDIAHSASSLADDDGCA
jgi:hypothetical protein